MEFALKFNGKWRRKNESIWRRKNSLDIKYESIGGNKYVFNYMNSAPVVFN